MNLSLKPPGGHRTANALLLFILGAALLTVGLKGTTKSIAVFGGVLLVSGLGVWGRLRWADWTGAIALLLWVGMVVFGMARGKSFRWTTVILMGVLVWVIWQLLFDRERKKEPEKKDGVEPPKPLTSFVLLLSGPRQVSAAQLAIVVTRAWGGTYGFEEDADKGKDEQNWVVGKSPIFLIKSPEAMYMVHNFGRPYTSDTEEMARSLSDLRVRKAVEDHRAWLAVDLMHAFDPARPRESFYPSIGRLIAELAGDDCLAVFHPESERINAWDDALKAALRGPDPLEKFALPVNPPVLQLDDRDPELLAGKAEARRRLPEFLDAFRRKDGEMFSVKAPVTAGGRTEHLWIEVDQVDDERIGGKLGNEPVDLGGMKIGDRVDVAISEVEDWVVVRGGAPTGLFTARTVGRNLEGS